MLEKSIQAAIKRKLESWGYLVIRNRGAYTGMPDLIVIQPTGVKIKATGGLIDLLAKVTFVEVKQPGKKPTEQQEYTHEVLRQKGYKVLVLCSAQTDELFKHFRLPENGQHRNKKNIKQ